MEFLRKNPNFVYVIVIIVICISFIIMNNNNTMNLQDQIDDLQEENNILGQELDSREEEINSLNEEITNIKDILNITRKDLNLLTSIVMPLQITVNQNIVQDTGSSYNWNVYLNFSIVNTAKNNVTAKWLKINVISITYKDDVTEIINYSYNKTLNMEMWPNSVIVYETVGITKEKEPIKIDYLFELSFEPHIDVVVGMSASLTQDETYEGDLIPLRSGS